MAQSMLCRTLLAVLGQPTGRAWSADQMCLMSQLAVLGLLTKCV